MYFLRGVILATALAIVTACAVGPNCRRPEFDAAVSYKEQDGWKPSEPGEAGSSGLWWRIFNDEALDELDGRLEISNENVKAAAAAFEEARALVSQARAGFWPTVSATASRQRTVTGGAPPHTTNSAAVAANWDLDVWGQMRRSTDSSRASAQASAAALAAARLSAQAASMRSDVPTVPPGLPSTLLERRPGKPKT